MHNRIERQARILTEFLVRTHQHDRSLSEAKRFKSIKLLYETIDQKTIVDEIKKTKAGVNAFANYFPTDVAAGLAGELEKLANAIPDTTKLSTSLFAGDENKIKKFAKDASIATTNASTATATTYNAMMSLTKALNPYFEKLDDDEKEMPIGLLADSVKSNPEEWKDKFIDRDSLNKGIGKAFVPSEGYYKKFQKGIEAAKSSAGAGEGKSSTGKLFATAGKFLTGVFQKKPAQTFPKLLEAFMSFMEAVSVNKFLEISKNMETKGRQNVDNTTVVAAESSSSIATVAGGVQTGKANEQEASPVDLQDAADDAQDISQAAETEATKGTLGSALSQALIQYLTPFQSRKSLSEPARKSMTDASSALHAAVTKELDDGAELTSDGIKRAIESWFSGLDPKVKKNLGGPKGSQKIVKLMAKNIDDIVKKNFALKQERRIRKLSDIILFEDKIVKSNRDAMQEDQMSRWQKMAGIK